MPDGVIEMREQMAEDEQPLIKHMLRFRVAPRSATQRMAHSRPSCQNEHEHPQAAPAQDNEHRRFEEPRGRRSERRAVWARARNEERNENDQDDEDDEDYADDETNQEEPEMTKTAGEEQKHRGWGNV
jgi:hypothetical protein